ncbi:hypothetical protein ACH35V_03070 [Actinomadura sp. 1N219]|uniref:hypothetical protein n=1 Tax=Actinomadura sp. 1N219 TaxID=3375152 RepID=UPI0037AE2F92
MPHLGLRTTDLERPLAFYTAPGYVSPGHVLETGSGSLTMLKLPDDPFAGDRPLVRREVKPDVAG